MSMASAQSQSLVDRMVRAAKVDEHLYEEVERDTTATGQAATVVVITAIATGLGAFLSEATAGDFGAGVVAFVVGIGLALLSWAAFAYLTYLIGTKVLAGEQTRADWGEVARAVAFAYSPRVLLVFGFVPLLGALLTLVVGLWVLWAVVVAVRAALDFSTLRAVGTIILGWLASVILTGLAFAIAGGL